MVDFYDNRRKIIDDVKHELMRQDEKWGKDRCMPNGTGPIRTSSARCGVITAGKAREECQAATRLGTLTWAHILIEEVSECLDADDDKLRSELIQVAAVALNWAGSIR